MIFHYIRFFYDFFVCFSLGFLLNDFFERKCPNEFKNFRDLILNSFVNTSYNCIYFYSKCQIFITKTKNNLNLFIESNPTLLKFKNDICKLSNLNDSENYVEYCNGFNFYIHNYTNNNIVNKQIFYNDSNEPINENSDIRFMLIEFKAGDNIYKIDLETDIFNYYLIGNRFTKDFFVYYVKKYINKNNTINENDKCSVKIIDHDVNNIEIEFTDKNESILLEKNGYKLNITNHPDNK